MQKSIPDGATTPVEDTSAPRRSAAGDRFRAMSDAAALARLGNMAAIDPSLVVRALDEATARMKHEFLCALADRLVEILMGERFPAATALALAHANPSLLEAVRSEMPQVVAMANAARLFNGQHLVENAPTPEQIISADIPGVTDSEHWAALQGIPTDGSMPPN